MSLFGALQSALALATRGVPAVRAAVHGARLGAGARFARSTVEKLGVHVVAAEALSPLAASLAKATDGATMREIGIATAGVSLRVTRLGSITATVSEELVHAAARSTARSALATIGRATALGALGGAALDAAWAGFALIPGLRAGTVDGRSAAMHVGKHAARGALAGAASVAAAGAVSAVVAATGITLVGTPVVVPLAAMVAAGALATRAFDRRFGTSKASELSVRAVIGRPEPT